MIRFKTDLADNDCWSVTCTIDSDDCWTSVCLADDEQIARQHEYLLTEIFKELDKFIAPENRFFAVISVSRGLINYYAKRSPRIRTNEDIENDNAGSPTGT